MKTRLLLVGQLAVPGTAVVPPAHVALAPQSITAMIALVRVVFMASLKVIVADVLSTTLVAPAAGDVPDTVGLVASAVAVATAEPVPIPPAPESPNTLYE